MKLTIAITFVLLWGSNETSDADNGTITMNEEPAGRDLQPVHSRQKRYIVFPKGSSLQILVEVLSHVPTQFRVYVGPTLQVAWPLPSDPQCFRSRRSSPSFSDRKTSTRAALSGNKRKIFSDVIDLLDLFGMTVGLAWQLPDDPKIHSELKKKHKIYKRNVFKKMELFINKPWGADGRQCVLKALCESGQRTPSKKDFLTEILHKIFSVEAKEEEEEEDHEDKVYRKAHQSVNQNCQTLYPECEFSFFNSV